MKQPAFRLNGKAFETASHITPRTARIKAFLEKLPDNDLLTTNELAKRLGSTRQTLKSETKLEALSRFVALVRYPFRQNVWGNPRTISELRKNKELLA